MRQPSFSASEICGSVRVTACTSPASSAWSAQIRGRRRAAQLHHLARQEAAEQMQRHIVGAEVERHADRDIGELLRRIDRGLGADDDRRVGDDGATPDLPAGLAGLLDAAVVAPFAGIIHVGLAVLEHLAVAQERVEALGRDDIRCDMLQYFAPLSRSAHSICKPFLLEQSFFIGDDLGQPLERVRSFPASSFFMAVLRAVAASPGHATAKQGLRHHMKKSCLQLAGYRVAAQLSRRPGTVAAAKARRLPCWT